MEVKLAYGRKGLKVNIPEDAEVIRPHYPPVLPDEERALYAGLRVPLAGRPLGALARPGERVVVVHTDITRATPNRRILPVVLDELEQAGVRREDITLLNGLGTHRPQTETELRLLLGKRIVDTYRCLQHDCHDDQNLVSLGKTSSGHPVRVNRPYLEADLKVLTGFIEPHFFAGYSGGPKAVLPSLAGAESVFSNHGYAMIAHPQATWGVTEGNPIWEEMREVALKTEPDFLVNVTLDERQAITGVFAGEMLAAHRAGCALVQATAMVPVEETYDVVLTTNSGYPLDQNLYQSVKGMSAAARIVRRGGAILMAAACEDGLPDHGLYADLLRQAGSPQKVLEMIAAPGFEAQDQWQVQVQAQILLHADVYVYADGLSAAQIEAALLHPCGDVEQTLAQLMKTHGPRLCVLPEGPQTIPYLTGEKE
jgi:nickel-dependent lactate racemase